MRVTLIILLGLLNLFCTGLLAGEEFVICYGVRRPLTVLEQSPQLQLRQALIGRLRILVPAVFAASLLSGIVLTLAHGFDAGLSWRFAALLALLVWSLVTLFGTVPINSHVLDWAREAPPEEWRVLVRRWERLDVVRACAAMAAFALFLAASAA